MWGTQQVVLEAESETLSLSLTLSDAQPGEAGSHDLYIWVEVEDH